MTLFNTQHFNSLIIMMGTIRLLFRRNQSSKEFFGMAIYYRRVDINLSNFGLIHIELFFFRFALSWKQMIIQFDFTESLQNQ